MNHVASFSVSSSFASSHVRFFQQVGSSVSAPSRHQQKAPKKKCRWLGVHETRQEGGCRMDKTPSVWPIWSGLEKQSPRGRISSGPVVETQAPFLSRTRPEQETRITDVKSVCALAPPISCRPGPTADLPRPSHHPSDGTRVPIASGPTPSTVHSIIRRPHQ